MSTWLGTNKNSASWSTETKSSGGLGYLLLETGDFLLLETSDKIILDETSAGGLVWSGVNKS